MKQTLNSTIASATRLTQSDFRLNLLLMKGQRYVRCQCEDKILKDNVKKRYKRGSLEIMSTLSLLATSTPSYFLFNNLKF